MEELAPVQPPIEVHWCARLLERVERDGPDGLDTDEILDVLAGRTGRVRVADLELADLARRSPACLRADLGLGRKQAARVALAFALGRRVERSVRAPRRPLRSPALVHDLMASRLRGLERETFHVLLLDGKHRLRRIVPVSEGTLTSSLVHPREVFAAAVRESAAALIAVHNHPSGDPEPSTEDLAVTRRLIDAGDLLGVPLVDHVIVAEERWVSLRERMHFEGARPQ